MDVRITSGTYHILATIILQRSVKRGDVRIFTGEIELSQNRYQILFQADCWLVVGKEPSVTINFAMVSAFSDSGRNVDTDFSEDSLTEFLILHAKKL